MIAPLERVTGMELTPQACVLCGSNPVDETSGQQQDCIFAPGVDVDWGSSVYICKSCVEIMADLFDRVTVEGFDKLTAKYETLKEEHEKLLEKYDRDQVLIERIRDGAAATATVKKRKVAA